MDDERAVTKTSWSPHAVSVVVGYPIPSRFGMTDLAHLSTANILSVGLDRLDGSDPHVRAAFATEARWINLVRLTDRALQQHEAGRRLLTEFLQLSSTGRIGPFYRAVDALEDCVLSTHRALKMAQALRADRSLRQVAPTPTQRQMDAVRDMRDAIMHTDDRIATTVPTRRWPPIRPGQPYMLRPLEHRLELGEHRLSFRDLAACLRRCHGTVKAMRGSS